MFILFLRLEDELDNRKLSTNQMLRNIFDALSAHSSSATFSFDVTPQWDDQQSLLGTVEKMYKKVSIIVPIFQAYYESVVL
jgi:hypothetical protein